MNKEQRKRMAYNGFSGIDVNQPDMEEDVHYTTQVSGNRVELHRE